MRLRFQDVTLARGLRILVQQVDFDLPAGAFWVLRGANGVGKTTVLQAAAGLMEPFAGRIQRRGAVSFLGHELALKPILPVQFYLSPDAAQMWGLSALMALPISALSAGQRKRVALARALDPALALWLLDEPLANLDAAFSDLVIQHIRDHCQGGGAVLAAVHGPIQGPIQSDGTLNVIDGRVRYV